MCDISAVAPDVTGVALAVASEILDAFTGNQFGGCQVKIRPCRNEFCSNDWPYIMNGWWEFGQWPRPLFYNGVWYNLTCGSCSGGCSCTALSEVHLPTNVISIDEVKIDGVVLDESTYRLDDFRKLVRIDGNVWPLCNELNSEDTEDNTWSITATYGKDVPELGKLAVGELMCELINLITGNSNCKLPMTTQSLVRQGVTLNFIDPATAFENGRIGLFLCDLFIRSTNPHLITQRATVFDIDGVSGRITGTA